MKRQPANDCTPDSHDWQADLGAAGLECCAWPGCTARREATVAVKVGVDVPGPALRDAAREREAA